MTVYIGVDLHVRTQSVCWVDTADGEQHEVTLDHQRDDVRAFYAQFAAPAVVGVEASGYSLWFHRLLEELGHHLLVGDALAIRQCARRRQKNDRRDARLLLDLLLHQEFPAIHIPAPASREVLALQPVELLRRMATLVPPPRCHLRRCAGGCRRSEPGLHTAAARAARVRALRVARRAFVVAFVGAPRPAAIRPLESQPPASAFLVDARHVSP